MERRRIARGLDSSDGGVPTPGARRTRVATAAASLVLAAAIAVYALWRGASGIEGVAAVGALALILLGVVAAWDAGLVAGSALLLAAYALSLAGGGSRDWAAPLVAVGLLGVVEFGSWSLELRDGAEERPIARVPSVLLLLGCALASSALVLAVGGIRTDAGLALWALGAAAAIGLLYLIADARARFGRGLESG